MNKDLQSDLSKIENFIVFPVKLEVINYYTGYIIENLQQITH